VYRGAFTQSSRAWRSYRIARLLYGFSSLNFEHSLIHFSRYPVEQRGPSRSDRHSTHRAASIYIPVWHRTTALLARCHRRYVLDFIAFYLVLGSNRLVDLGISVHRDKGQVTVSPNPTTKGTRATGSGWFIPSFGQRAYQVFFCFDASDTFVQAKFYQTVGSPAFTDLNQTAMFDTQVEKRGSAGVLMGFPPRKTNTLSVRMGISWTSTSKACAYAEEEIPDISAFDAVHTAARYVVSYSSATRQTLAHSACPQNEMERGPWNCRG
jgi:hypothetical protein